MVLIVPKKRVKFYDSDTVSVVSNICRRPIEHLNIANITQGGEESNEDFVKRFNDSYDIGYLLHEIKEEKPYFQNLINKEDLQAVWCVNQVF